MLLAAWMEQQGLNDRQFGEQMSPQRKPVVVWRYRNGQRRPNAAAMAEILRVTAGQVTPNDFHELPTEGANDGRQAAD